MLTRILCAGALALSLPAAPVAANDITATIVAGHPPVFRWVRMISEVFVPAVQAELEGTGHTITFSEQYGGAVAGVGEELETVGIGLAEIGTVQSLFDPAKLAVQNVTYYTPFVTDDSDLINAVMGRLHREDDRMQAAYLAEGVTWLGAPIEIDDYLLMTKFPVTSLADLDGKKIAAPGPAINWLSGTGAVGVSGNLTTYYNELQTGVYDGVIVFASAALPGRLYEVAPYVTRMGLGAQHAGGLGANTAWFESQPEEVQAALIAGADAADAWYSEQLKAAVDASFAAMAEAGATITDAPAEMREAWAAGMNNAAKVWAEDLDARGLPGTEMLTLYMETARSLGAEPLRNWDQE
ncbi:MAG: C4-dicarboxylate TRAP transporter substrate-binding protein [Pseudomonadota bacterium]